MTCSASCGSQRELVELLIKNAINEALAKGDIQAGIKDCDGGSLGKDSKVVLCNALVESVNEAIKNGEITVVKDVTIEDGKLKVTDGTGKAKEITLPGVKSVTFNDGKMIVTELAGDKTETVLPFPQMAIGNNEVVLTNPNGEHVSVPKTGAGLTEDNFDKTIVKGANETDKLGVKVKTDGGLEATEAGVGVKVKPNSGIEATADGVGVKVNPNGGLETTGKGVGIKAGDGLKLGEDGSLQVGEIFTKKPITGKGTKVDPLTLTLNNDQFQVNAATGEVSLKPSDSTNITDLNTGVPKIGYSTFYGWVGKARGDYVTGIPADVESTNATEASTTNISQLADGQDYDFNGWQIASPVQVDQYFVGTDKAVWHRVNDEGMNKDGTLKDPSAWSVWHRETNVTTNVLQLEAMQKQVDDLTKRVATLETLLGSFVDLKDASGKVLLGSIKP